jgi:glycosyltransferase involved in cell wall biosynthesis
MFDGRMLSGRMTGISRHLINLLDGLNQVAPQNKYTVVLHDKSAFEFFGDKVDVYWADSPFLSPMEILEIPSIISELKPNIFHNPSFSPIIPKRDIPYLITIHDLINITHSRNQFKKLYYKLAIKRACRLSDRVLTVSEYSKGQIVDRLGVRKDHISVIYNGIPDKFYSSLNPSRMEEVRKNYSLPEKYILYVGSHDVHKNLKGTISAYMHSGVKMPLVLALSWEETSVYCSSELKPEGVICIGPVSDRDLPYLYKGAELFLFMSFIEGFGMPVVEAFASGVPVITSNVTSLPEVSRGCAVEVDPSDVNAMAGAIKMVLSDDVLKKRNIELGKERAQEFTVQKMAQRVLTVYDEILHK